MAAIADGEPTTRSGEQLYPPIEMGGTGNSKHYAAANTKPGGSSVSLSWSLSEEKEWVAIGININAAR